MIRKILSIFALALLLAGCAGMEYAMEHYGSVPVKEFTDKADTWRIFDKPKEGRLMITPSVGAAMAGGVETGLTLGMRRGGAKKAAFQKAALAYLKSTDRQCTIQKSYLVVNPQWEFKYSCQKK